MKAGSKLEKVFAAGHFAVTGELGPPRGADAGHIHHKAKYLKGIVESVNVTDNQTAVVRMASMAVCRLLLDMGIEPNLQMVCRDRNRLAIQADLLGASALGIKNVLCLSGDHQKFGSQPEALNVFDIDSINLLRAVRTMRDQGQDMSGFELDEPPRMFIGAAANPFADPLEYRVIRLAKKIEAGADFIQTQCVYNLPRFREWLKMLREAGLTEKVFILAGVTPLKSARMADYMASNVAGMDIPESVLKRMGGVPKEKAREEGLKICLETISELRQTTGVRGVHIMAIQSEEMVPEIIEAAGLLPRPQSVIPGGSHA